MIRRRESLRNGNQGCRAAAMGRKRHNHEIESLHHLDFRLQGGGTRAAVM